VRHDAVGQNLDVVYDVFGLNNSFGTIGRPRAQKKLVVGLQ